MVTRKPGKKALRRDARVAAAIAAGRKTFSQLRTERWQKEREERYQFIDALAETADKDRNPICYAQEEKLVFVAETGQVRWLNDASLSVFAARAADFVVISKKKDKETGETDVVPRRVQPPMNIMAKVWRVASHGPSLLYWSKIKPIGSSSRYRVLQMIQ